MASTVPNRFSDSQARSAGALMADFDYITGRLDLIEAWFSSTSPFVLTSGLTVNGDIIANGGVFETNLNGGGYIWLKDNTAGADLKRSRLKTGAGVTVLESRTDAQGPKKVGLSFNHTSGDIDFPQAVSAGSLSVGGSSVIGAAASFSAYLTGSLSVTDGDDVVFDTEEWDIPSIFSPGSGIVTPPAGQRWRLSWLVSTAASGWIRADLYKVSTVNRRGGASMTSGGQVPSSYGSALVLGDGSAFKVVLRHNIGGSTALVNDSRSCIFQGERVG